MNELILAINPGSTSTKIAVYAAEKLLFESNIHHPNDELALFDKIADQFPYRKAAIIAQVEANSLNINDFNAIIGRGGLTHPIESGTYAVDEEMKNDLRNSPLGDHASNLGGLIADDLARDVRHATGRDVRAYVADPVVVDEMDAVARVAGHPLFERKSVFHALNQKAVAKRYALQIAKPYDQLNLIVAHLGGGISVGAHKNGRVVDVNNTLDGEGPMTPERSGTLPVGDLVKLCFSGKYTQKEIAKMVKGEGGLVAYMGTNDVIEILGKAKAGDEKAALMIDAMCYNVAKNIGAMAAVLCGEVDAVIITGGMAYSDLIVEAIGRRVRFIAPLVVYAGQDEMNALAASALGVLRATHTPKSYADTHR